MPTETAPSSPQRRGFRSIPLGCSAGVAIFAALIVFVVMRAEAHFRRVSEWSQAYDHTKRVLDDQVEAWNRGDLDGFMAGYWNDDGLFYISGGKSVRGWKALKERYEKAYQGEGKEMGKLKFNELEIQPLGPDAALCRGKWEVVMTKETVGGWFTLVFRKFPEG